MTTSLTELKSGITAELSGSLLNGGAILEQSSLDVIASMVSFLQFSTETALEKTASQLTPATATGELLDAWGQSLSVARLSPSFASGVVLFVGPFGSFVPAGTTMTRCDGLEYRTTQDASLSRGLAPANIQAVETGAEYNLSGGSILELGSVIPGISSARVNNNGITGGAGVECDDNYRARVLGAFRSSCRTGRCDDYDFWVRQYPGVTRTCCVPLAEGPGTVKVYFMMDDTYSNGIPAPADVLAVQDLVFGETGPAPPGIVGQVCAPEPVLIDVDVNGVGPITTDEFAQIREAIEEAFLDFFDCGRSFVCRADIEIALRQILRPCFNLITPSQNIAVGSGKVPILGNLTVS